MDSAWIWASSTQKSASTLAGAHGCLRELERIANESSGQGVLQGFCIGHTSGLVRSRLGLQAGQLLVAELKADQLGLGLVRECVAVVVNVVDFDGGHVLSRAEIILCF